MDYASSSNSFVRIHFKLGLTGWHHLFWRVLWLSISALIFGYSFFQLAHEAWRLLHNLSDVQLIVSALITFLVAIFVYWLFDLSAQLRIQKIHNQPSWVYYAFFGIALSPFASLPFFAFQLGPRMESWVIGDSALITVLAVTALYLFYPATRFIEDLRFAAGAVGIDGDLLDFRGSASNVTQGIRLGNKYVEVVAIYGGPGFGKSSYARMIVEGFDVKQILYTYLSLTETNEAKDFSRLFAERWLETIKQRYPKIDTSLVLPFMQSVFRESGNGVLAGILSYIPGLHKGLIKTRARVGDERLGAKIGNWVPDSVAGLFGNIHFFSENLWIVMLDEIERANFDEVYRLVEVIERFKSEGRTGLPIRLVFVLCISDPEFRNTLDSFKGSDHRAYLINHFFYGDPKSLTLRLSLPPVSSDVKRAYILKQLKEIVNEGRGFPAGAIPSDVDFDTSNDPSKRFLEDQGEALAYMLGLLWSASPREILRVTDGLDFFATSFRDRSGDSSVVRFRVADLLAMEYIKIHFPVLLEFFERTIERLLSRYREVGGGMSRDGMNAYFYRKDLQDSKLGIVDWIEREMTAKIPEQQKKGIEKMVGLICFDYIDFLSQQDPRSEDTILRADALSFAPNLQDYLHLVRGFESTPFQRYNEIYQQHKDKRANLAELTTEELMGYSRFVGDARGSPAQMNLDLLFEIVGRILQKKITIANGDVGDTIYDAFIYQFIFQMVAITEKDSGFAEPSVALRESYEKFQMLLQSSDVPTGAKYIVLNSLANDTRGTGSEIHGRLGGAFVVIQKYWDSDVKILIQGVFSEAKQRYFVDNKVIYENEENFIFTMYQGWSGDSSAADEIKKIKEAARRGLKKNPNAIKTYWNRFSFDQRWSKYSDVKDLQIGDRHWSSHANTELYMPLVTLVEITEKVVSEVDGEIKNKLSFWKEVCGDKEFLDDMKLKDDPNTLRAVLTRRGLLEQNTG